MNEMKDYQGILRQKAGEVKKIFEKYQDVLPQQTRLFSELNESKISTVMPEIMVYGIYNAGKSSILNELIGKDVATVKDIPETDKVTYYEWQSYRIADTPGVAAPIAHENVTVEHLKKADIVLFVMSTTGSNERIENYARMKSIADAGKKIIIVLNDKNGDLGRNETTIQLIKQQVAKNMQRVGIEDVDEKYCIVTVNAARAHKGRTDGKPALVAMSGIDELKNVVLSELKRTSPFHILCNTIGQLETIMEEFIASLEGRENSELLKKMNHVLETFNRQKIMVRRQINTYIDIQSDILASSLPQIIWEHRQESDHLNQILGQEVKAFGKKVQAEVKRQLEDIVSVLSMELKSFAGINIDAQSVDAESFRNILVKFSKVDSELKETTSSEMVHDKENALDTAALLATATTIPDFAAGIISESGKILAQNLAKTTIGKAIAETAAGKILGSVAGTIVPVIGPIVTLASGLSLLGSLLGGNSDRKRVEDRLEEQNRRERQRVEAEMQARQELQQKSLYLAENLANELKDFANASITDVLAKYETPFKDEIAARRVEGQELADDIQKLRELCNEYDLLRIELGAR